VDTVSSGVPASAMIRAYRSRVALLTDDVFMSMPPMPFEYEGRDVVARFCASIFGAAGFDLVPRGQSVAGADAWKQRPSWFGPRVALARGLRRVVRPFPESPCHQPILRAARD
jgi:hypothetical protein